MRQKKETKENKVKSWFIIGLLCGILRIALWGILDSSKIQFLRELFGLEFNFFCNFFNLEIGEPCGLFFWVWFFVVSPLLIGFLATLIFYLKEYLSKEVKRRI